MQQRETRQLVNAYNGRPVVDGVAIAVRRGEIIGLLGPTGAGPVRPSQAC